MLYENPVICGMYPDPSVCEKDGVYYLVNSTFEYFPGIPIFQSRDLVEWEQIGNICPDPKVLGLTDVPPSSGIFAVTIRYHEGKFYIITTAFGRKSLRNFFMTAGDPKGPWSDPIFVPVDGIDPSLFWEDGKTYVQFTSFGEISQAVIDEKTGDVLEGPKVLTHGCGGRDAEGPHLFHRGEYYYLLLAEGGTKDGHMVTMMRSRNIWGPFEASPYNPVLSAVSYPDEPLQCVGHADLADSPSGRTYAVCLGTRPVDGKPLLGRETLLAEVEWTEDGWLKGKTPYVPLDAETEFDGGQKVEFPRIWKPKDPLPLWMVSPRANPKDFIERDGAFATLVGNGSFVTDEKPFACLLLRQYSWCFRFRARMKVSGCKNFDDDAGVLVYQDPMHYAGVSITRDSFQLSRIFYDFCQNEIFGTADPEIIFTILGDRDGYHFYVHDPIPDADKEMLSDDFEGFEYDKKYGVRILDIDWKILSSYHSDSQNTGAMIGVFAEGKSRAQIMSYSYEPLPDLEAFKKKSFFK